MRRFNRNTVRRTLRRALGHTLRRAFDAKVREGIFKPVSGILVKIPAHLREDREQEILTRTWLAFERRSLRGQDTSDNVLRWIWRRNAMRPDAPIAGCEHKPVALDALSDRNQRLAAPAACFDEFTTIHDPTECVVSFQVGLATMGHADPTARIIEAIDTRTWFGLLSTWQRRLVTDRARGLSLQQIARKHHRGRETVTAEITRLGEDLRVWLYEMQ